MNTQDKDYAEFDAFIRQYEAMHGSLDEASAWAGWKAARLIAESEKPEWRTIDSAPADGQCLVWCETDDGGEIMKLQRDSSGNWLYEGEPLYAKSFYIEATHWMPLPAKPDA